MLISHWTTKETKQVVDPDRQVSDMGVLLLNNLNA